MSPRPGAGQLALGLDGEPPPPPRATDEPPTTPTTSTGPAAAAAPLADDHARDRIRGELDTTLFVEAGAGAGKTTQLSARVVNLVGSGIPITAIAAITFTEKAAAELRHRIRRDLRDRAHACDTTGTPEAAEVYRLAVEGLDHAAIGTLHAFAGRILREFPVEAEVPPGSLVLDEVGSDVAFEQRWSEFVEDLLAHDDSVRMVHYALTNPWRAPKTGRGSRPGISGVAGLRAIARAFADNWDLVRDRVDLTVMLPPPIDAGALVAAVRALRDRTVVPDGDKMAQSLTDLDQWLAAYDDALDEFDRLAVLDSELLSHRGLRGSKANWKKSPMGETGLDTLRAELAALEADRTQVAAELHHRWSRSVGAAIGRFTLASVEERRSRGELEFHDLLVLSRDLVVRHAGVRRRLHRRYERVLLDEFQDTDPIQLELAVRITADPDLPEPRSWTELQPLPGHLFLVGDPKQSIYRFRRADIGQYLGARTQLGADEVLLTTNFRSTGRVLAWVNHVFAELIRPTEGSQPEYHALDAFRTDQPGSVTVLGAAEHADAPRADELRRREATDVVGAIRTALHEQWPVRGPDGTTRPCTPGDITVLLPSRTPLPILEAALLEAGIAYQAENSSLVYATDEIRSLLLAVRAIDDPADELALVASLRSPLFGCSDRDLFEWRVLRGGSWSLGRPLPARRADGGDDPVHAAFRTLRSLVNERHLLSPSATLQRLVEECRVLEVAVGGPGTRDVFRRVRFVIDQARAWSDAGGAGLRSYLAWTRRQGDDGRYVAEVVLPETDLDAVRIMTIHAAKGLEFPITIVAGLTTRPSTARSTSVVWPPGTWDLANGREHEAFRPIDEQMGYHERLRLLYVACTRAADHLVVSLHRTPAKGDGPGSATAARVLAEAAVGGPDTAELSVSTGPAPAQVPVAPELPWSDPDEWAAERAASLRAAARPRVRSATSIAVSIDRARRGLPPSEDAEAAGDTDAEDGGGPPSHLATEQSLDPDTATDALLESLEPGPESAEGGARTDAGLLKDGVDLELPPWQRGRYGTAIGRAVHAVLQSVDLATGDLVAELAASQAAAEGIAEQHRVVEALARSAWQAPIVQLAARSPHWRELYVAAPLGDVVIEGYVDLLVRTDAGLVLVDYKTDHAPSAEEIAAKVERYAPQLAVYGAALEVVTGEAVVEAVLVFAGIDGPREVTVPSWPARVDSLRASVRRDAVGTPSPAAGHSPTPGA